MTDVFAMGVCVGVIAAVLLMNIEMECRRRREAKRATGRRLFALRQALLECRDMTAGGYLLMKDDETLARVAAVQFHRRDAAEVFDSFVEAMANQVRAEGAQ